MLCEICEENEAVVKVQDTPYKTMDACATCKTKLDNEEPEEETYDDKLARHCRIWDPSHPANVEARRLK